MSHNVNLMMKTESGRKKLAFLMVPAIRAAFEGTDVARQALFMKRRDKEFSKHITWKDMEDHFGLKRSKVRKRYENQGWSGWWELK